MNKFRRPRAFPENCCKISFALRTHVHIINDKRSFIIQILNWYLCILQKLFKITDVWKLFKIPRILGIDYGSIYLEAKCETVGKNRHKFSFRILTLIKWGVFDVFVLMQIKNNSRIHIPVATHFAGFSWKLVNLENIQDLNFRLSIKTRLLQGRN